MGSLIHFQSNYVHGVRLRIQLHSLTCGYLVFPAPFVESQSLSDLEWEHSSQVERWCFIFYPSYLYDFLDNIHNKAFIWNALCLLWPSFHMTLYVCACVYIYIYIIMMLCTLNTLYRLCLNKAVRKVPFPSPHHLQSMFCHTMVPILWMFCSLCLNVSLSVNFYLSFKTQPTYGLPWLPQVVLNHTPSCCVALLSCSVMSDSVQPCGL